MMVVRGATSWKVGRRGSLLAEVTIAAFVVVVAMGLTVKVLGWLAAEHRAADRRQWAIQTVANAMERIASGPFDRVTAVDAREVVGRADAGRVLPGAEWEVTVDEAGDSPAARKVSLRLRWRGRSGDWVVPVRLTSWVFERRAAK